MICKRKDEFIGLIFNNEKAFKFTLSGVNKKEIDILYNVIQKNSGMEITELPPKK
jgi:hypothetical protein